MKPGIITLECGGCGLLADLLLSRICDRAGGMVKPRCPACDGFMWVYQPQATDPIGYHTDLRRDLDHEDGTEDFEREERR